MNVLIELKNMDYSFLYFLPHKANKMYIDGTYTKILYTHTHFTTNGIWIHIPFVNNIIIEKQNLHYYQIKMDLKDNYTLIEQLSILEKNILSTYQKTILPPDIMEKKQFVYTLTNQLIHGNIKVYNPLPNPPATTTTTPSHIYYYIKISGIWETPAEIGMTYKIKSGIKI